MSVDTVAIGSKFYETLREFEVFSPGLLVFWPAGIIYSVYQLEASILTCIDYPAWSLTLVAMRTQMLPEQYGLQLAAFLLQTVVGYNVGNLWEKFAIGAFSPIPSKSPPIRKTRSNERAHALSVRNAQSKVF